MDPRPPKALIGINISDATQHALIQQQRLNPRAPFANSVREFFLAYFEWIGAESSQLFGKRSFRQVSDAAKTPGIGVAQFTPVIQEQANVGVFFEGQPGWNRRDLPSHPQMHKQRRRRGVSICGSTRLLVHRRQPQQPEFSVTLDGLDLTTRQMLFQRGRVVDKVRLTQRNGKNSPPENRLPQSSRYRLDFWKFRHH